ncbi:hypothetical protein LLE49_22860 [Alicyclobacillus tolerans]|uniref:hypothetical protein n=1 Tax=Alicyclobacillus tolerans TaxID=90970 RepID=UPI001F30A086|nr:hypothetical protein [Alicyclobacillus tolerans]MCF8567565.1 hypothetical protein [Alicyclobacillus tolerans]
MAFLAALGKLFRRRKVCVYVTMGDMNYTRVAGQLENAGIPFYVKMGGNMNGGELGFDNRMSEYEIYVKRENEEQARFVLGTSDMR